MTETCHECQTIVEKLNLEFNELYLKYEIMKNQRYNEIIKDLFFRIKLYDITIESHEFEETDLYLKKDENGNFYLFDIIAFFENQYQIIDFDEKMKLLQKLSEYNLKNKRNFGIIYENIKIDMQKKNIKCLINFEYSFKNYDIITEEDIKRFTILKKKICPTWFKTIDECECKNCMKICDGFG